MMNDFYIDEDRMAKQRSMAANKKLKSKGGSYINENPIDRDQMSSKSKGGGGNETDWKDYALPAAVGAASLGTGLAEVFMDDEYDTGGGGGSVPGGSSPVGVGGTPVSQPFSGGRMQLTPQQRQSLALAMLGRMV